jgi:Flp pilus assembly pilin Flp
MNIRKFYRMIFEKIKNFFLDENGGSFVEYALLLGFGLFIFFIIFSIISNIMNWTIGLSEDFFNLFALQK